MEENNNIEDNEIKLSYETIYEFVRIEKSRDELQELMPAFYSHVTNYIEEKKTIVNQSESRDELGTMTRTEQQLSNVRRLVKELYERRERKIINLAIMKARTFANITDFSIMLPNEKALFDEITILLEKSRKGTLSTAMSIINRTAGTEIPVKNSGLSNNNQDTNSSPNIPKTEDLKPAKNADISSAHKLTKVCFKSAMPKFAGPNLENYGPYSQDDIAELPEKIAAILIKKGRAKLSD